MSHADANFRNTGTQGLVQLRSTLGHTSVNAYVRRIAYPPFLDIACEETLEADLVKWGIHSFYRTNDLIKNRRYYAREIRLRVDTPKKVKFTVTATGFVPYITLTRNMTDMWASGNGVLEVQVESEQTGPFVLEVSSVSPYGVGHFIVKMECDETPLTHTLIPDWGPGTVDYDLYSYYGPWTDTNPELNLVLVDAPISLVTLLGLPPTIVGPYTWEVTGLPPGLSVLNADPLDTFIIIEGVPTLIGTYSVAITTKKDGERIAAETYVIEVRDPVTVNNISYFQSLWTPGGHFSGLLLWTKATPESGILDGRVVISDYVVLCSGIIYANNPDGDQTWSHRYAAVGALDVYSDPIYGMTIRLAVDEFSDTTHLIFVAQTVVYWCKAATGVLGLYTLDTLRSTVTDPVSPLTINLT